MAGVSAAAPRTAVRAQEKSNDDGAPIKELLVGAGAVAAVGLTALAMKMRMSAPNFTTMQNSAADGLTLLERRALAESDPRYPTVVLAGNGLEAAADAQLAPHFIRREDVPEFLSDSLVKNTVHHGATNENTYYGILLDGARTSKNKPGRQAYGQGFYTALKPGGWGDQSFELAVKVQDPSGVGRHGPIESLKRRWNRVQPDAHIVRNSFTGGDWVIAKLDPNVKLVVDLPGQAPGRPANAPGAWDSPYVAPEPPAPVVVADDAADA